MATALEGAGLRVWLDQNQLTVGDNLREKIDDGLAQARFGIVILSAAFFSKEWPQRELDGLTAREEDGRKVVLPVWHGVDRDLIARHSPTLANKLGLRFSDGLDRVVSEILRVTGTIGADGDITLRQRSRANDEVTTKLRHKDQQDSVAMFLDQSESAFLKHLSSSNAVWIVGITNQNLIPFLDRAYAARSEQPWDEIRIIFQSRDLVSHFGDGEVERLQDQGVQNALHFFLQSGSRKSRKLDIRHSNRILPFVGQFYDYCHVRVAFVLHVPQVSSGCYLNYRLPKALTKLDDLPGQPRIDETLKFEQYKALRYAFEDIRNISTPLLTANVIGERGNDGSFVFTNVIPQNNWRHYRTVLQDRPAHLVSFILLHDEDRVYLQYRDESNARGQTKTYGVIPGKVNDEDCFQTPPEPGYWAEIAEMQKVFSDFQNQRSKWQEARAACRRASDAFAQATGIRVRANVSEPQLLEICRRAACRYLDEKLGLDVGDARLYAVPRTHYFVQKQEYSLYIKLFAVRIVPQELDRTRIRRPFANLHAFDIEQLQTLRRGNKLTMFLDLNLEDILLFLQGAIHSRAFRKGADG